MSSFSGTTCLCSLYLLLSASGCFLKPWLLIVISSYLLMMYMDGIDFFFYEPYISLNLILILPTWKMMIYPLRCGSNFIEFLNALGN